MLVGNSFLLESAVWEVRSFLTNAIVGPYSDFVRNKVSDNMFIVSLSKNLRNSKRV